MLYETHYAHTLTALRIIGALKVPIHLPRPGSSEPPHIELGPQLPARPAAAQQLVDAAIGLYGPQQLQGQAQRSPAE